MISVHFQGKSFNITVIKVYALTSDAKEAEVDWFHEDIKYLLEPTPNHSTPPPKKRYPFHHRGLEYKMKQGKG